MGRVEDLTSQPPALPSPRVRRLLAGGLLVAMVIGAIILWVGIPTFWLFVASYLHPNTSIASFDQFALVIVAIPATMVFWTRLLFALDRRHRVLTDNLPRRKMKANYMRSMHEDATAREASSALDVILVVVASLSLVAMAVWFFVFAGSSLPHP